jgi:hypothetical protein
MVKCGFQQFHTGTLPDLMGSAPDEPGSIVAHAGTAMKTPGRVSEERERRRRLKIRFLTVRSHCGWARGDSGGSSRFHKLTWLQTLWLESLTIAQPFMAFLYPHVFWIWLTLVNMQ